MRARDILLLSALLSTLCGCSDLLDLDYETGCGPSTIRVGEACRRIDACAEDEVPIVGGDCEPVGVENCGALGPERDGGCALALGEDACPKGKVASLVNGSCVPLGECLAGEWTPLIEKAYGATLYVKQGAAPASADGSATSPYPSLGAAFAAHPAETLTLLIHPGEYVEPTPLEIEVRVQIVGMCPADTTIRAVDPERPVITLRPGAANSLLSWLAVSGAGTDGMPVAREGIRIEAEATRLQTVYVHDTVGAGISFDDAHQTNSLDTVLVENTGIGIVSHGSSLTAKELTTKSTRGAGISIHPSRFAPAEPSWDAGACRRSDLVLRNALVEGAVGEGIFVEGSDAILESVVVRALVPGERSLARGIAADWKPTGAVRSTLDAKSAMIVGPFDVGIDVWNADATLSNVVLDGRRTDDRCLGMGIRARADALDASLALENALIRAVSHTGVRVEGLAARVDHSIVRGVEADACDNGFGDGVSAESYAFRAANLELVDSRIDSVARAAAVSFGPHIELRRSLLSCNAVDIVASPADVTPDALCGCTSDFRPCLADPGPIESPLVGSFGCDSSDQTSCVRMCIAPFTGTASCLEGVLVREIGEPAAARSAHPQLSDSTGYIELDGTLTADEAASYFLTHPGYLARSSLVRAGAADAVFDWPNRLFAFDFVGTVEKTQGRLDLSLAVVRVELCHGPRASGFSCGSHTGAGIVGSDVSLLAATEAEVPIHVSPVAVEWFFVNVTPGYRTFRLALPPGSSSDCTLEIMGTGWQAGGELVKFAADEWRLSAPIAPGRQTSGIYVTCTAP